MDLLRALSTIAVILIHVTGTILYNSNSKSLTYNSSLVLNQLTRFSVPAFIFLSGFGLALSYKKESKYLTYLGHRLKKSSSRLLCMVYCIYFSIRRYKPKLS